MSEKHQLFFQPVLTDVELDSRQGKFLDDKSFDLLINNKTHPNIVELKDEQTKKTFAVWIPKLLSIDFCKQAFLSLRSAATETTNRGVASGDTHQYRRADGSIGKTTRGNPVNSAIIGYFDRSPRRNYCRSCAWNYAHMSEWQKAIPMIEEISKLFESHAPEKFEYQSRVAKQVHKDWLIGETVFSTVTVNKNFRTALHRDGLNLQNSFSAFNVLRAGNFVGGHLVFPRYRIAISADNQDLLFFMPQEPHGNTEMKAVNGKAFERISLVYYLRDKMRECGTLEQEFERGRRIHGGS